jgi:antitoxin (DNA-binding transcriptional repressor) of toxin-antitoxin stability system
MKRVNMHDAKRNLSRHIAELKPGETIQICNRNEPVAELRAFSKTPKQGVRIGVLEGQIEIPDSFFEPLPDDLLRAFNCEGPLYNEVID